MNEPPSPLFFLIPTVIIIAVLAAVAYFIDKAFKESRRTRLPNAPSTIPFSSPRALGTWTTVFFIAVIVLAVVAVGLGILQIGLLSRLAKGSGSVAEVIRNDSRQGLIEVLQVLLLAGTGVAFLAWFHRLHSNLPGLGNRGLKYSPGWAVGGFFVPILSFFRPFQVMREVWHGSDPGHLELDLSSDETRWWLGTPTLVGWWWALFIMSNYVAFGFYFNPTKATWPIRQTDSVLMAAAFLLEIPSALVTIRLVRHLTSWQIEKAGLIREQAARADASPSANPQ